MVMAYVVRKPKTFPSSWTMTHDVLTSAQTKLKGTQPSCENNPSTVLVQYVGESESWTLSNNHCNIKE